jgi:DNA invertase Pin-like site-specific DNA recombinase
MTGALVGYGRTSTTDQQAGLEAQIAELQSLGCTKVFAEHVSSVDDQRPELRAALDWCREGDTFVVTRPDRLARSVTDLLRIVEDLRARKIAIRILSLPAHMSGRFLGCLKTPDFEDVHVGGREGRMGEVAHGVGK